ncbi:hypothetical protein MTO96_020291 [Rhipicephalus appendiculatus]
MDRAAGPNFAQRNGKVYGKDNMGETKRGDHAGNLRPLSDEALERVVDLLEEDAPRMEGQGYEELQQWIRRTIQDEGGCRTSDEGEAPTEGLVGSGGCRSPGPPQTVLQTAPACFGEWSR